MTDDKSQAHRGPEQLGSGPGRTDRIGGTDRTGGTDRAGRAGPAPRTGCKGREAPGRQRLRGRVSGRPGWVGVGLVAALSLGLAATIGLLSGGGCGNRAGMNCQQQSDCSAGLLCNKPPLAGPQGYGICEPGQHGLGEICISTRECDPDLVCSTELGQPSQDGWHGVCQARTPVVDAAAAPDLSPPPDLAVAPDLSALDGGTDL